MAHCGTARVSGPRVILRTLVFRILITVGKIGNAGSCRERIVCRILRDFCLDVQIACRDAGTDAWLTELCARARVLVDGLLLASWRWISPSERFSVDSCMILVDFGVASGNACFLLTLTPRRRRVTSV